MNVLKEEGAEDVSLKESHNYLRTLTMHLVDEKR